MGRRKKRPAAYVENLVDLDAEIASPSNTVFVSGISSDGDSKSIVSTNPFDTVYESAAQEDEGAGASTDSGTISLRKNHRVSWQDEKVDMTLPDEKNMDPVMSKFYLVWCALLATFMLIIVMFVLWSIACEEKEVDSGISETMCYTQRLFDVEEEVVVKCCQRSSTFYKNGDIMVIVPKRVFPC